MRPNVKGGNPKSRFRRMDASAYFLLMTIFEFQSREGIAHPRAQNREEDAKTLDRLRGNDRMCIVSQLKILKKVV